ncbi:IS3 family transposase [Lactiplantibacillus plantarum]|uniref:IS3 family transposase n=1 Tax=Lactiplantibacillus plantarum TaxID=1590 RepID=UPI0009B18BA8|nr:hypothetical protein CLC99_17150 [Lactiplantibacillus plantarum]MBF9193531.1 IS3 family transposase [Lactiplantibacillus plantarum]QLK66927.1 IS3 family transposase [Lactiplantibacillus plantarum]
MLIKIINVNHKDLLRIIKAGIVHNCQYKNYKELEFTITSYVDYYTHCHIKTKSASISPVKHRKHTSQLTT